ncbi:MAG: glutamine--tRNA ligase/YqeY domain fusion protein [Planctomycetota bacterium]
MTETAKTEPTRTVHFIEEIMEADVASGKWGAPGDRSVIRTRFPPEPNGYLHIGHAKAVCISFGLAERFGGTCNLRFDDTNPVKEEQRYADAIAEDIRWLGFRWPGAGEADAQAGILHASDYFPRMHEWAVELITKGKAYVDDQDAETIRAARGTPTVPGTPSPFRDRPVEESLDLFERMRRGEFGDGARVVRAKIDMASPNFNLRDPVMYRVLNTAHHRTGDAWHIYPMYDWAHGLEDSIEGITHSLCSLEFEDHRALYDWFIDAINEGRPGEWGEPIHHPQQIEFARLNPTSIVTSKRKLRQLVDEGKVSGWDDPRMPTLSGLRRRGYTPESIRSFCETVGVTKFNATHDITLLENALREDLNARAPRRMCVLDPLKVVITNWGEHGDEQRTEWMAATNNPENEQAGTREVPFARELFIERDDFMEEPPNKKWFRLKPGGEVRLRYGYWITCQEVIKDDTGEVVELRCTYDPQTRGGDSPPPDAEGKVRKVKGTVHWVSAGHAVEVEVREYDRLFTVERPDRAPKEAPDDWDWLTNLNADSLRVRTGARLEPNWPVSDVERSVGTGDFADGIARLQFERHGYYAVDGSAGDSRPIFNCAVTLRDSWSKK